ncbi:MAG TPA: GH92 family glycosyl hydrolase [Hanamia sp.]|nr:GH92 family glycosyl hydrolase [Hanamia sp.]
MSFTIGFGHNGYAQNNNHLRYVDPFIGTTRSKVITKWGSYGGTYPGAVAPSGAIQLTPETRMSDVKGYDYVDSAIYYFSCFDHSSGFPEGSSGRLFVMPVNTSKFKPGEYRRYFSHAYEVARPGYYKVVFNDDHTIVETTTSTRTGLFRFTFASHIVPRIFIGDAGEITMKSAKVLYGSNANTVINFSEEYLKKEQVSNGWIFTFASSGAKSKVIVFKLSKSSVGIESAQKNIDQEIGNLDFDAVYKRTRNEWSQRLSVIDVTDSSQTNKTIFYTALYHSLLIPWVISDADGRYRGYDRKIHQKSGGYQYGKFSPWDSFRSLNPLLSLLYPDKEEDIILSMLDIYKQAGHLPVGPMTGNHVVPIIVDSYLKGIDGFDKTLAYTAMKKSIVDSPFTRSDMEIYKKDGYVPDLYPESVTSTVEYAYDDWALSQFSKYIICNKDDYKTLLNDGYNYRNLFNVQTLFLLPRNKDKFKLHPGNSGYKEGDKWIYSYFVPQNVKDLVNLMGGNDQFAYRLDSALSNNLILFDNETVFHIPYLFNQAGKPSLTQKWCRKIMLTRYSADPGGIPGNDDLGAMSSWYVFSALGIYPVCPGRLLYTISSPLFQSVTLHLANGKRFVINCVNSSSKNSFIQSLTVNGKPEKQLTISHSTLLKGGTMAFRMGRYPGKWAANIDPIELSETKRNPDFRFLSSSASKEKVEPDEQFAVHFSLINKGGIGTKIVKLYVKGKQYAYKNCLVLPGQLKEDSITCRLYPVGKTVLKIDKLPPIILEVKSSGKMQEQSFRVTRLAAKPMIKQFSMEHINYTVQNIGGYNHIFHILLTINDSLLFTDSIEIAPGAKKNIEHTIMANQDGLKIIKVGGIVKRYKVYNDNLSSLLLDFPAIKNTDDNIIRDRSGFQNNGYIMWSDSGNVRKDSSRLVFGKDCFVEVPNSESLDIMGQTITMMAWVYPTKAGNGLIDILTKGDNDVLQVHDGRSLSFFAGGWGRGECEVELPENWIQHWHHIAGVCTGKKLYLFIDGILRGTTVLKDTVDLSNFNIWNLGRNEEFPSARIFNGYMKMVKIFEAPLTQKEIESIVEKEKVFINE